MKHCSKQLIPERTITVIDHCICDLCGEKIHDPDATETSDRTVERKVTHDNGCEGGSKTESIDICDVCWDSKLVPWLASQGTELRVVEDNW